MGPVIQNSSFSRTEMSVCFLIPFTQGRKQLHLRNITFILEYCTIGSLQITQSIRFSSPQVTNKVFTKQNQKMILIDLQEWSRMQCKSRLHETCSKFRVTNGSHYTVILLQLNTPFWLYNFATKSSMQGFRFGWRQF